MSVIKIGPGEFKGLEQACAQLCGDHVRGEVWREMFLANHLCYAGRNLTDQEFRALADEYDAAPITEQLCEPNHLLGRLKFVDYNITSNGGCRPLEQTEHEAARRRIMDSVAFEAMPSFGSQQYFGVGSLGYICRVDFDTYEIHSHDPHELDGPTTIGGELHPLEGQRFTDPREAFKRVWELNDACSAAWDAEYQAQMDAWKARLEGKTA